MMHGFWFRVESIKSYMTVLLAVQVPIFLYISFFLTSIFVLLGLQQSDRDTSNANFTNTVRFVSV